MTKLPILLPVLLAGAVRLHSADHTLHTFKKIQLTDQFWAEGATSGDFNHDGKGDVAYGPYWWEGPDFAKRHEYYPATESFKVKGADGVERTIPGFEGALGKNNTYSENFLTFTWDFNHDGWDDLLVIPHPGKASYWHENPKGKEGHWTKHLAHDVTENESPWFEDITGDGKPELICNSRGYFGYAEPNWKEPNEPWKFHNITSKGNWQKYTHGVGMGDINGDGRMDLLEKDAWWEQPASLAGDPEWVRHAENFGTGGSQMFAYDVDGDGDNDVITALAAHGYGLAWYENVKENGKITFKQHIFVNKEASENRYGVHFSQPHAMALVDMDGDGIKDLVTGKRFWAHGSAMDPEPNAPAVLYWFKLVRNKDKTVDFVPHLVDDNSGVGTQVQGGMINKDKWPDLLVGNKRGAFVFLHEAKKVGKAEWEAAQPKPTH